MSSTTLRSSNLFATTKFFLPPKTKFVNSLLTTWQHLKESLGDSISSPSISPTDLHCLHSKAISSGFHRNLYISTHLITKYFHFRDAHNARKIFTTLTREKPINKTLVWNSLIKGYLRIGLPRSALDVYNEMVETSSGSDPDRITFHLAIMATTQLSEFELGCKIEGVVRRRGLQCDLLVATGLIGLYLKGGDVESARKVFDGMPKRDVVAWNAMISGYLRYGCFSDAMGLFESMKVVDEILPSEATLVSAVTGCADLGLVRNGMAVHVQVTKMGFETNLNVVNSLTAMYISCDCLDAADKLFKVMVLKDAISWSTMIGGYVEHGHPCDALRLFHRMVSNTWILPTRPILLSVLAACANLGNYQEGKKIKERYLVNESGELISDAYLITAFIYMCAKCEQMEIALQLLDEVALVRVDVVAWNAVIKACVERKQQIWVLELTRTMQRRGINPDAVTFISLLSIISSILLPRKGMETHGHVIKRGLESDRTIANSLIDMYARSGNISDSCRVFDSIQEKDVVSWSSMIKAYAWNGNAMEALDLFLLMRKSETRPNHITFLAILSACSHAVLVDEGRELFRSMEKEYGLKPGIEHFSCMVDIFCRAGLLKDAYHLLKKGMQNDCTNPVLWGSLLNACRVHGDALIGEAAAQHLYLLEPNNAANYLVLAHIYISAGRREDANSVLDLLRGKGLERRVGCSWFDGS